VGGMEDSSIGFLCRGDSEGEEVLLTDIDDDEVVISLLPSKNIVINIEPIIYTKYIREKISGECKLVVVNQQQMYRNRFYPRVYYDIYRLQLQLNEEDNYNLGFIIKQFNGTTGSLIFYFCKSYWECRKKIREEEGILED
jgi:hypothetical protein